MNFEENSSSSLIGGPNQAFIVVTSLSNFLPHDYLCCFKMFDFLDDGLYGETSTIIFYTTPKN
jgi:hypothetical protein